MVRVVLSLPLIPGIGGFFDSFEALNGFIKQAVVSVGMLGFVNGPRCLGSLVLLFFWC